MPPPAAPRAHGSERLQVFQQIGKLSLGQLAQARDGVGAVGAGEGFAQRLGAAVVKVGVLVVKAAQGGWVVAAVGVVGLFESHGVDLAIGEFGTTVAGVARRLGGPIDDLAALGFGG